MKLNDERGDAVFIITSHNLTDIGLWKDQFKLEIQDSKGGLIGRAVQIDDSYE